MKRLNARRIERTTERIIDMLGINGYVNNIEYRTERSNMYGYMQKAYGGYDVVIYINECKNEKEVIHTIAHELRHVWQCVRGFKIEGKYGLYRQTYSSNIFEIDANKFGDIIAYGKRYKTNEQGLYINDLHIIKYAVHTVIAKAIA